jgi:hypothetical protein
MLNQDKEIQCAISTAAMDDLEGKRDVKPYQRVDQFMRLREVIEEQASRKFFEEQVRVDRPRSVTIQRFLHSRFAKAASPQLNIDLAKGDLIGLGTAFFGLADCLAIYFLWRSFSLPVNGQMLYRLSRRKLSGQDTFGSG